MARKREIASKKPRVIIPLKGELCIKNWCIVDQVKIRGNCNLDASYPWFTSQISLIILLFKE